MSRNWPFLPDILYRVAEECGLEAALVLGVHYGGRRLHVPKNVRPGHELARLVGMEVLEFLVREAAGDDIDIPMGPAAAPRQRAQQVATLDAQGLSAAEIARRLGISERTVFNHRARRRDRPGQQF